MDDVHRPLLPSDRIGHATSSAVASVRRTTKRYLTSKTGHYSVIGLVALDVTAIFADLLLQSLICEGHIPAGPGGDAQEVLGVFSLVFSCLFMLELLVSIWSFGWQYFASWFHWLDAIVIIASFLIDVILRGISEEIGSIVIVLRLWRVFKIIEELSAGAQEQMDPMNERLQELELENGRLKSRLDALSSGNGHD
ncbi:hypothetical protein K431DRAFT_284826 [Polychaeton citri CBS 116435]|uniref:Voltage-gated hydrogen channel 1 n=1 Tax=Polychaeton citri CBS 116435 TaxID=1314669 RepID=A0A9P4QAQ5_9PEZI|nr:hypothetical protein K431DRAFT_284826 [Polychaeton citri CBS 116435]